MSITDEMFALLLTAVSLELIEPDGEGKGRFRPTAKGRQFIDDVVGQGIYAKPTMLAGELAIIFDGINKAHQQGGGGS